VSSKQGLVDFLCQECKQRQLSPRRLSQNSGLSPATLHNIINRKYQPSVSSLNRLADYLNVKRQYLLQLAGLLDDMDYGTETFNDSQRLEARGDVGKDKRIRVVVAVSEETRDGLDFIRRPGQSYDGVIQELIEFWKRQVWETTRVPSSVEIGQRG